MSAPVLSVAGLVKTLVPTRAERRVAAPFTLGPLDLELRGGDALALIGPNGAGKSTLLRLVAGTLRAEAGRLHVAGRVAPVVGLTSPFSPLLSPREHMRTFAVLTGSSLDPDAVLAFAELDSVADRQVRHLSRGQRARLALAPGILSDAELYLVDEGLAVCDAAFRARAIARLRTSLERGAAVMLAGQDLLTARALCPRALLLEQGTAVMEGDIDVVIAAHTRPHSGAPTGAGADGGMIGAVEVGSGGDDVVPVACTVTCAAVGMVLMVGAKAGVDDVLFTARVPLVPGAGPSRVVVGVPTAALRPGARVAVALVDANGVTIAAREHAASFDEALLP